MEKYECEIDKLLNAVIDLSNQGVSIEAIIRNLIKNQAKMKCNLDDLREEFQEFKLSMEEDEDDDE